MNLEGFFAQEVIKQCVWLNIFFCVFDETHYIIIGFFSTQEINIWR